MSQLSCSVWPSLFLSSIWLASIGDLLCWHCSVSPLLAFLAFAVCVMDTRFIYTGWELQGRMEVPILRTIHGSVGITPLGVACCVKLIHWQMSRSSLCRKMIRKTDNDLCQHTYCHYGQLTNYICLDPLSCCLWTPCNNMPDYLWEVHRCGLIATLHSKSKLSFMDDMNITKWMPVQTSIG